MRSRDAEEMLTDKTLRWTHVGVLRNLLVKNPPERFVSNGVSQKQDQ